MDQILSEHPPEPQRFEDSRPGKFTQYASHLIPVLAVALAAGCGTSGDFIPYSDLPPAAEQDEILVRSQATATTPVKETTENPSEPASTAANEPSKNAGSVDSTEPSEPIANPATQPTTADATKPAESTTNDVAGAETVVRPSGERTSAEESDATAEGPRMVVSSQSGLQGPADVPEIENTATEVREIKLLIPEKRFLRDRGTTALRVSYDDIDLLKVLNMEPVPANAAEHFPGWLQELNGKSVRIRGFMFPTFEASGLTEFTMARDNGICCFVRKPKIYDVIGVSLAEGVTTDYIEGRPFDVEGTFHIEPASEEQGLYRLYRISNARVVR
jgi:hypothetical protein